MSEDFQDSTPNEQLTNENLLENTASFNEIKEVAASNISQLLQDLQDFETAIKQENIPEIYRIYHGKLHNELKETSNQNHEIDDLLMRKLHDNFLKSFPFMKPVQKVSPTIYYYQIGEYYRERATIGIDASIPEIFVIPAIDNEWQKFQQDGYDPLDEIQEQIDQLDAKKIAAQTEIQELESQIEELKTKETEISQEKGFFNRSKIDEEIELLTKKRTALENKKSEWLEFTQNGTQIKQQKEFLAQEYRKLRLNRALVEKEFRLIRKYFGSAAAINQQIEAFLKNYLQKEEVLQDE